MQYNAINTKASDLVRFLATFQMFTEAGVPAPVLGVHVRIVRDLAGELAEMLEMHPDAEVEIDGRHNQGMEEAYRKAIYGDRAFPDTIPDNFMED